MLPLKFLYILVSLLVIVNCDRFTVNTTLGQLRGREFKARNGRTVLAFSGIPFAKPPLGELRFQDPQPPEPWSGVRGAYNFGSVCVQMTYLYPQVQTTIFGHEDCLYLSVYTPTTKPDKLLPVIVYFHGGGYYEGSGEADRTPEFFMDHDVVMVMPNYRLSAFGFLSTEDEIIAGNMGLKDQVFALVWVNGNIANFGGDPNMVTLMGESAGGYSVQYHMMSRMSEGLFHRGISQSGSALGPGANYVPGKARRIAKKVAELFNCPTESSKEILQCLRTKNSYEIVRVCKNYSLSQENIELRFLPVFDEYSKNAFIPKSPHNVEARPIPWLTGVVSLEGIIRTGSYVRKPEALDNFDKKFYQQAPIFLAYKDTAQNPNDVSQKIKEFYFNDQPISEFLFRNLTDLYTDSMFVYPMVKSLQRHKAPTFVYYLDYHGKNSLQEVFAGRRLFAGACHSDETLYIWRVNNPFVIEPPTMPSDLNMSRLLVKVFVNFATFGNPTPEGFEFNWPQWNDQEQKFISFRNRGVEQNQYLLKERMEFWAKLNFMDKVDSV